MASWEASLVLCTKGVGEEGRALAAPGVGRGEAPFNKVESGVNKGIENIFTDKARLFQFGKD